MEALPPQIIEQAIAGFLPDRFYLDHLRASFEAMLDGFETRVLGDQFLTTVALRDGVIDLTLLLEGKPHTLSIGEFGFYVDGGEIVPADRSFDTLHRVAHGLKMVPFPNNECCGFRPRRIIPR